MLSSFSFGKILKTFLPGSVLTLGLLLCLDAYPWFEQTSLFRILFHKDRAATSIAALVPLTLFLGFLLNSVVWSLVNPPLARSVQEELDREGFGPVRDALKERRNIGLNKACRWTVKDNSVTWNHRECFEYFYLPVLKVERLSFLWESYFSWYEFHINSLVAIPLAAAGVLLWDLFKVGCPPARTVLVALAVGLALIPLFLYFAARKRSGPVSRWLALLAGVLLPLAAAIALLQGFARVGWSTTGTVLAAVSIGLCPLPVFLYHIGRKRFGTGERRFLLVAAVLVPLVAAGILGWDLSRVGWFTPGTVLAALAAALFLLPVFLYQVARKNLLQYQRNLLVLIAGALTFDLPDEMAKT